VLLPYDTLRRYTQHQQNANRFVFVQPAQLGHLAPNSIRFGRNVFAFPSPDFKRFEEIEAEKPASAKL
jgi:hypothetical protein